MCYVGYHDLLELFGLSTGPTIPSKVLASERVDLMQAQKKLELVRLRHDRNCVCYRHLETCLVSNQYLPKATSLGQTI